MATRVYRLNVRHPAAYYEAPDWEPENWAPEDQHWERDPETGAEELLPFAWPGIRDFLSRGAAERRADRFRKYGATVTVEASDPITWGGAK